nr:unnamed protein product [Callosobruchus analis]
MSKVMEIGINTQLLKYLDNNNIIHDRQYGFRKHRSTGDLLAYVTNMWNRAAENHGESLVVALHISKAFDRVRGCSSDLFSINAGVPQESVLSPTLFLLYINELLELTFNPIYSFTYISIAHGTRQTLPSLETAYNNTYKEASVEMEGRPVVESSSIKLLGININSRMTWHDHVVTVAKMASQKLGAQIRSLEYCSHVWACVPKHSLKLLDSILKRAVRLIDTPILTKGLRSLEHRRKVAGLSLFYRFYHGRFKRDLDYSQEWHCKQRIKWLDLGPDYFPRYLKSVECLSETCWFNIYKCRPRSFAVKLLKRRRDRCSAAPVDDRRGTSGLPRELRELWVWEERAKIYTPEQLLLLYKAQIRPSLEY